jgi:shikimate kinase/3-dehydroquinate synthase
VSPALVFIGFMGAGKSTAAREVARKLGTEAVDTDELLAERFGMAIPDVFERHGEAAFREAEERVALEVLGRDDAQVIALGGGTATSARVRAALAPHTVVLIDIDVDTAWRRAHGRGRPLAQDRDAFAALYAERAATYDALADAVLPQGERSVFAHALEALLARPDGARLAWGRGGDDQYPVWVGRGILGRVPFPARIATPPARRFCVSDEHVAELHVDKVGELAALIEIPPGEEQKTVATYDRVLRALAASGARRSDVVVALGGGVVGDLAGFAAATYQRGMPVVQVPTTLVAQVDSAYGGKTGVDLPEGKNYAGAYHQPSAVIADTATLATLPPEEHAAGYAEVVKTALIAGGRLWERIAAGDPIDDDIVFACARTKLGVVAQDERDGGRRQVLNLGHTIGHALETVTGYARFRHGEAVGLGLLAALRLSGQDALRAQVRELLEAQGLPTSVDGIDAPEVVAATARDKKRVGEATPYVLVEAPGDVRHGGAVSPADALAAVAELVSA